MAPGVEALRPGGIDVRRCREAVSLHSLGAARRWRIVALGEPIEHRFARQPRVVERRPDCARMDLAGESVEGAKRARRCLADERIIKRRASWLGLESERGGGHWLGVCVIRRSRHLPMDPRSRCKIPQLENSRRPGSMCRSLDQVCQIFRIVRITSGPGEQLR